MGRIAQEGQDARQGMARWLALMACTVLWLCAAPPVMEAPSAQAQAKGAAATAEAGLHVPATLLAKPGDFQRRMTARSGPGPDLALPAADATSGRSGQSRPGWRAGVGEFSSPAWQVPGPRAPPAD